MLCVRVCAVGGTGTEAAIGALLEGVFKRVVAGATQGGVAGYVDRAAVVASIREEAARKRTTHVQVGAVNR